MIFIDASRYNNTAKRTGVENYSYFLINILVKMTPHRIVLISPRRIPLQVKQIIIPFKRLWTQIRLSWQIWRNKKINNLFVPSHFIPIIHPKNIIITIHDVAFRHLPQSYGLLSRLYLHWGTKFAVKHAKKIIVPSAATKKDLINLYNADSKKITIIPLGFKITKNTVDKKEGEKILKKYNLQPKKYFLYLGRIERKKNTDNLIKAFDLFVQKNPKIKLVLAGFYGKGGKQIINSIPKKIKNNIILTGYISEKKKNILFKNALCFVFPSHYEGFGLPLLEAMHYRLPIIASKIPTSYEIAKKNALFFNPHNVKALAKNMIDIVNNTALRKKLISFHAQTLKKYSWEKCAKQTLDLLL